MPQQLSSIAAGCPQQAHIEIRHPARGNVLGRQDFHIGVGEDVGVVLFKPGQPVRVTLIPGKVFPCKLESVLQAVAIGQTPDSGAAVAPKTIVTLPLVVRIKLGDTATRRHGDRLPTGSTGHAAIYSDHVNAANFIRQVLLRQIAITNYINPF
jgi:hypothetical protein